ncbi:MAG: hypothetical protein ACKO5E_12650 [bacterium]
MKPLAGFYSKRLQTAAWLLLWLPAVSCLHGQHEKPAAKAPAEPEPRQVTAMTIRAVRGNGPIDPKLNQVADKLRQVLPGYHFALVEGRTVRLDNNGSFTIAAGSGSMLEVKLQKGLNDEGKVELALKLMTPGQKPFEPVVNSPPNQLFFVDRKIRENERLLIAVGAR